jgi:nucleotide-binding universal stress UspA family protein
MYTDILLPTDGSQETADALSHTLVIAGAHDATVHVLDIVDRRHQTGTHGKTGREQLASLGSTTERVVERSNQPVLVVDIGAE